MKYTMSTAITYARFLVYWPSDATKRSLSTSLSAGKHVELIPSPMQTSLSVRPFAVLLLTLLLLTTTYSIHNMHVQTSQCSQWQAQMSRTPMSGRTHAKRDGGQLKFAPTLATGLRPQEVAKCGRRYRAGWPCNRTMQVYHISVHETVTKGTCVFYYLCCTIRSRNHNFLDRWVATLISRRLSSIAT